MKRQVSEGSGSAILEKKKEEASKASRYLNKVIQVCGAWSDAEQGGLSFTFLRSKQAWFIYFTSGWSFLGKWSYSSLILPQQLLAVCFSM